MLTSLMQNHLDPSGTQEEFRLNFALITVDEQTYNELINRAGVPHGSNILINYFRNQIEGRWTEFTPFIFDYQTLKCSTLGEVTLHGELRYEQVPNEIVYVSRGTVTVVVPYLNAKSYVWFAESNDIRGFVSFMHDTLDEIPLTPDALVNKSVRNLYAEQNTERNIVLLIMVFVYGFVGMLTLIALTNVISTISTNVRSRSREFAVLQSVGMTHSGINRMLNLESILCTVKSLIYGVPLGILASYLIYRSFLQSVFFSFHFPIIPVAQCILAVFIITWVTMRYAASRLRNKNIVETIRTE
jgi:putative ABC transport system permease protein